MEQIILSGMSLNDFLLSIGKLIDSKLNQNQSQEKEVSQTVYMSRHEVCRLLKISLPTLNEWSKLGKLQSYKIGNRVLYKKNEVESALHQVTNLKFKKI